MTTPRYDKVGAVTVPVTAGAPGVSLASTCDPALSGLLADFRDILRTKLSAAWTAAARQTMSSGNVVEDSFPHAPTPQVVKRGWSGPALFLWRESERHIQRTTAWRAADVTLKLLWVLPPLPEDLALKLEPMRVAVRTCLWGYIEEQGDPTKQSGTALSAYGIDELRIDSAEYAYLPSDAGLEQQHPALEMTLTMREREDWVLTQYAALTRIDTTITVKDDTGETEIIETQTSP